MKYLKQISLYLLILLIVSTYKVFGSDITGTTLKTINVGRLFDTFFVRSTYHGGSSDVTSFSQDGLSCRLTCTKSCPTISYDLTEEQRTVMWNKIPLDLTKDFLLDIELRFKKNKTDVAHCDGEEIGGEGITFAMIKTKLDTEENINMLKHTIGRGMGYLGIADNRISSPFNFFAVEFDTRRNDSSYIYKDCDYVDWEDSINYDHIAFLQNSAEHRPRQENCKPIDITMDNVKDSAFSYCVRIKWKKPDKNNMSKILVYVKSPRDERFRLAHKMYFDSLNSLITGLDSTHLVNWGITAGASSIYKSIQSVVFKNLFIDDPNEYIYMDFGNDKIIYSNISFRHYNDTTILYPSYDNCDMNITSFTNDTLVCWQNAKEVLIQLHDSVKVNWYDNNSNSNSNILLDSAINQFDIWKNKQAIVDNKLNLKLKLIKYNYPYIDTLGTLYFLLRFKNSPMLDIPDGRRGFNTENNIYKFFSTSGNQSIYIPWINRKDYELDGIDNDKFVRSPSIKKDSIVFELDTSKDFCYTDFILRRKEYACSQSQSIKIRVYKYIKMENNNIRFIRTCAGNKLQIHRQCLSDSLIYKYSYNDTIFYSVPENGIIELSLDENDLLIYVWDKKTNKQLDDYYLWGYTVEDIAPLYEEEPEMIKLERTNDTCKYVIKGKFSYLDTNKYKIQATFDTINRNLHINSSLEFLDTIKLKCVNGLSKEYKIDIHCNAQGKFLDTIVCRHSFNLNCSCDPCKYCDAFNENVFIKVDRDSAGTLIPLNGDNGFHTPGRYCKFRIDINGLETCENLQDNLIIHNPDANSSGEWQTQNIDSLVYLVTGPDYNYDDIIRPIRVNDIIKISYITPNGDTCTKEQKVYCDCYVEICIMDITLVEPSGKYSINYTIMGHNATDIKFKLKDSQGNSLNTIHSLGANSPLSGNFMFDAGSLVAGTYFIIAERNGQILSSKPAKFIKK